MASNIAGVHRDVASLTSAQFSTAERPAVEARMTNVTLSGTVLVDYDVMVTERDGSQIRRTVRVEFPDEVRSMLESSTWGRGITILEAVSQLGIAYLCRLCEAGLLRATDVEIDDDGFVRPPETYHLPLSDLRPGLAAVCAAGS